MHSFGLTERWIVLAEFPLVVNPLALALSGRPYIENYQWKPELGTRFTLIDRASGKATGGFQTDACFAFHHINAYDDGGRGSRRPVRATRTPASSRICTSTACVRASRSPTRPRPAFA